MKTYASVASATNGSAGGGGPLAPQQPRVLQLHTPQHAPQPFPYGQQTPQQQHQLLAPSQQQPVMRVPQPQQPQTVLQSMLSPSQSPPPPTNGNGAGAGAGGGGMYLSAEQQAAMLDAHRLQREQMQRHHMQQQHQLQQLKQQISQPPFSRTLMHEQQQQQQQMWFQQQQQQMQHQLAMQQQQQQQLNKPAAAAAAYPNKPIMVLPPQQQQQQQQQQRLTNNVLVTSMPILPPSFQPPPPLPSAFGAPIPWNGPIPPGYVAYQPPPQQQPQPQTPLYRSVIDPVGASGGANGGGGGIGAVQSQVMMQPPANGSGSSHGWPSASLNPKPSAGFTSTLNPKAAPHQPNAPIAGSLTAEQQQQLIQLVQYQQKLIEQHASAATAAAAAASSAQPPAAPVTARVSASAVIPDPNPYPAALSEYTLPLQSNGKATSQSVAAGISSLLESALPAPDEAARRWSEQLLSVLEPIPSPNPSHAALQLEAERLRVVRSDKSGIRITCTGGNAVDADFGYVPLITGSFASGDDKTKSVPTASALELEPASSGGGGASSGPKKLTKRYTITNDGSIEGGTVVMRVLTFPPSTPKQFPLTVRVTRAASRINGIAGHLSLAGAESDEKAGWDDGPSPLSPPGRPCDDTTLTVLAPDTAAHIEVTCHPQREESYIRQWIVFWFEGVIRGAADDFTVRKFVIARKNLAININPIHLGALTPEARPFYPLSLRTIFDRPAHVKLSAIPPAVPLSRFINTLQLYDLSPNLHAANRVRMVHMNDGSGGGGGNSASAIANDKFERLMLDEYRRSVGRIEKMIASSSTAASSSSALVRRHLSRFEFALYAEELQMECDIRVYDIFNAQVRLPGDKEIGSKVLQTPAAPSASLSGAAHKFEAKERDKCRTNFVYLEVPGVGERRPALNLRDSVQLRLATAPHDFQITCYVCHVMEKHILLSFPLQALSIALEMSEPEVLAQRFHARFSFDRQPFRMMYRALSDMETDPFSSRFLFPPPLVLSASPKSKSRSSAAGADSAETKTEDVMADGEPVRDLIPFDPLLNEEQLSAVSYIASKRAHMSPPYIIFGPPGTGKTLTLIEAILQVRKIGLQSALRSGGTTTRPVILVCTPSNNSADIIVQRLAARGNLTPTQLIRLNAYQRYTSLLSSVERYSRSDRLTGMYEVPVLSELRSFQIVVCTCAMAGKLISLGVPRGHFTHIFFDESGEAMEPEMLIPLCLADHRTSIVLAGDPRQLGAAVHSGIAARLGLKVSLQERLLTLPCYTTRNPRVITQLVRNYRAHPALLTVPSTLFYGGALKPYAVRHHVDRLTRWPLLPNQKQFPLAFVGVTGPDFYDPESSSISNPLEASKVVELIVNLLSTAFPKYAPATTAAAVVAAATGDCKSASATAASSSGYFHVQQNQIGVIAPYRKQVLLLRKLLRARNLWTIKVGTVDDYQGMEEDVMIVSTVVSQRRSVLPFGQRIEQLKAAGATPAVTNDLIPAATASASPGDTSTTYDSTVPLGILRNEKRFNVALSRAKCLTLVVGNPYILKDEPCWSWLLDYCVLHRAYTGVALPPSLVQRSLTSRLLGAGAYLESEEAEQLGGLPLSIEQQQKQQSKSPVVVTTRTVGATPASADEKGSCASAADAITNAVSAVLIAMPPLEDANEADTKSDAKSPASSTATADAGSNSVSAPDSKLTAAPGWAAYATPQVPTPQRRTTHSTAAAGARKLKADRKPAAKVLGSGAGTGDADSGEEFDPTEADPYGGEDEFGGSAETGGEWRIML